MSGEVHVRRAGRCDICGTGDGGRKPGVTHVDEGAEEARAATAPGGPLEFVHAGGRIVVPLSSSTVEDQLRGAIVTAVVNGRPTLFDGPEGREAVLISRKRYTQLVQRHAAYGRMVAAAGSIVASAETRLAELANAHGCEAAAETAREQGQKHAADQIAIAGAGTLEES